MVNSFLPMEVLGRQIAFKTVGDSSGRNAIDDRLPHAFAVFSC